MRDRKKSVAHNAGFLLALIHFSIFLLLLVSIARSADHAQIELAFAPFFVLDLPISLILFFIPSDIMLFFLSHHMTLLCRISHVRPLLFTG